MRHQKNLEMSKESAIVVQSRIEGSRGMMTDRVVEECWTSSSCCAAQVVPLWQTQATCEGKPIFALTLRDICPFETSLALIIGVTRNTGSSDERITATAIPISSSHEASGTWLRPGFDGVVRATVERVPRCTHLAGGSAAKDDALEIDSDTDEEVSAKERPASPTEAWVEVRYSLDLSGLAPSTHYLVKLEVDGLDIEGSASVPTIYLPLATWHLPTCVACASRSDHFLRVTITRLDNELREDVFRRAAAAASTGSFLPSLPVWVPELAAGRAKPQDLEKMRHTVQATPIDVMTNKHTTSVVLARLESVALLQDLMSETTYRIEVRATFKPSMACDDGTKWGLFGPACYVQTLPKPRAVVVAVSPVSATIVVERIDPKDSLSKALSKMQPLQRERFLAVGGADEELFVVARVQQVRRGAPTRRSIANSMYSRNHSSIRGGGGGPASEASLALDELHPTLVKDEEEDESGSNLSASSSSSSEGEDQVSHQAGLGDDHALSVSNANALSAISRTASMKCEVQRSRSAISTDFLISGLVTADQPFVLDGLTPRTTYTIKFFTLAPGDREDLLEVATRHQLRFLVDPKRFIGKSYFITNRMMRASISGSIDDAKSFRGTHHSQRMRNSTGSVGFASSLRQVDDGFIHNDYVDAFGHLVQEQCAGAVTPHSAIVAAMSPESVHKGAFSVDGDNGMRGLLLSMQLGSGSPHLDGLVRDSSGGMDLSPEDEGAMKIFLSSNPVETIQFRSISESSVELVANSDLGAVTAAAFPQERMQGPAMTQFRRAVTETWASGGS